ncbi:serine hydrolase [Actinorhabdospora filicis]|uniref:Beta-lactamase n=1 Tax=Actinorhabdospora filicis TaxID=1785913 RepID=A0A9W6WCF1_9ACTN|nr:serine hydrolase [Actinorhabdospora filicis]GLZ79715.1 serine hydrolase [Actinorhabdospora filicis]
MTTMKRRGVLGLGVTAATGLALPAAPASAAEDDAAPAYSAADAARRIARVYARETARAGGTWHAHITVTGADGVPVVAVDDKSDVVVSALSTNKLPVALAVLDRVDKGLASLAATVDVKDPFIVWDGDGVIPLDGAYPSTIVLGHALSLLLSISEDTSSRLCSQVVTAAEVNAFLTAKGFARTQVEPIPDSRRWYLGDTTAREMHGVWRGLVRGEIVSRASSDHLLRVLASPDAFHEGVRRHLSTTERARVATKAGWLENDGRHEAGVIFDAAGAPVVGYSMYAFHPGHTTDYTGNHPLIEARARMGRAFFTTVEKLTGAPGHPHPPRTYNPSNG